MMSGDGLVLVSSVSEQKSIVTLWPLSILSPPQTHGSIMSTSNLWGPCLPPMVLCICSPVLTTSRGGQRLYPSQTVLPTRWPKHLFRHGFLDLVYPPLSPQTAEDSSNKTCGRSLLSYLVLNTCTTSYHPIANGLVEWFHRHFKSALKASPQPEHWTNMLPLVLLGIRTSLKQDLGCTAAELVYGTSLRLPGEFFSPHDASPDDSQATFTS